MAALPIVFAVVLAGMRSSALAAPDPAVVLMYDGFGTTRAARVWGRVLEDKGVEPAGPNESLPKRIKRNIRLLESDEIPNVEVELSVLGKRYRVKADGEGLFRLDLPGPLKVGEHAVKARLLGTRPHRAEAGVVHVWPAKPTGVAVISDIDDTVLATGVGNKAKLGWKVLTTNARKLKTYKDAARIYKALHEQGRPIVFVSGSPINLYPRLAHFFELRGFPRAPLLLKNLGRADGSDALRDQRTYKLRRIKEAMDLLPGYRLVLIGDSGEQDPEIYAEVRRRLPKRVAAIVIRRASDEPASSRRFRGQLLFQKYEQVESHLRKRGLLRPRVTPR